MNNPRRLRSSLTKSMNVSHNIVSTNLLLSSSNLQILVRDLDSGLHLLNRAVRNWQAKVLFCFRLHILRISITCSARYTSSTSNRGVKRLQEYPYQPDPQLSPCCAASSSREQLQHFARGIARCEGRLVGVVCRHCLLRVCRIGRGEMLVV